MQPIKEIQIIIIMKKEIKNLHCKIKIFLFILFYFINKLNISLLIINLLLNILL